MSPTTCLQELDEISQVLSWKNTLFRVVDRPLNVKGLYCQVYGIVMNMNHMTADFSHVKFRLILHKKVERYGKMSCAGSGIYLHMI